MIVSTSLHVDIRLIVRLHEEGLSAADIGLRVGLKPRSVRERLQRARGVKRIRPLRSRASRKSTRSRSPRELEGKDPLPPGHALTWSAISDMPFPGSVPVRERHLSGAQA